MVELKDLAVGDLIGVGIAGKWERRRVVSIAHSRVRVEGEKRTFSRFDLVPLAVVDGQEAREAASKAEAEAREAEQRRCRAALERLRPWVAQGCVPWDGGVRVLLPVTVAERIADMLEGR